MMPKPFLLSVGILLSLFCPLSAAEKSYEIAQLEIDARLLPDGSMRVDEKRTFAFTGSFSFAFRRLPIQEGITFGEFSVQEEGIVYRQAESGEPGTFRITRNGDEVEVKWFYKAADERRIFTFSYSVHGAVRRYDDAAVLYYQFISKDWGKDQKQVAVMIHPPQPDSVRAWLHGPLEAAYRIDSDGTIHAWSAVVPSHSLFEIRALFSPNLFPEAPTFSGSVRQSIAAEEAKWAEEANRLREIQQQKKAAAAEKRRKGIWPTLALAIAGIGGWLQIRSRYAAPPILPPLPKMSAEIPATTPPALVSYLVNFRQVYPSALPATLMDLARRGFLNFYEDTKIKKSLFGSHSQKTFLLRLNQEAWSSRKHELHEFEQELISYLFEELNRGNSVLEFEELERRSSDMEHFFRRWQSMVSEAGQKENWFDENKEARNKSLALSGLLAFGTLVLGLLYNEWAIAGAVVTLLVFVLSFFLIRRTPDGEQLARRWLALKGYLRQRQAVPFDLRISALDQYVIYGIALGAPMRFVKNILNQVPAEEWANRFVWYHTPGGFSPHTFADSFSSMVSSTVSTLSTASGSGGGASGGGGGGASSGGG
ncbi:MAG: DUF2207 domain-containing protein, partial [candidate division KSB1 bacterium]|nr:DUF2207 domain-containing protein [candidate division KSB1 bacterium]